jgi:hypothetical protein
MWQTAQNTPNTGRIYGFFNQNSSQKYVQSAGALSLNNVLNSATPADRNKPLWRIVYNAASHEYL